MIRIKKNEKLYLFFILNLEMGFYENLNFQITVNETYVNEFHTIFPHELRLMLTMVRLIPKLPLLLTKCFTETSLVEVI